MSTRQHQTTPWDYSLAITKKKKKIIQSQKSLLSCQAKRIFQITGHISNIHLNSAQRELSGRQAASTGVYCVNEITILSKTRKRVQIVF